jgi:hypothetical protein
MKGWVHLVFALLDDEFFILHPYFLDHLLAGILEFPVDLSGLDILELVFECLFEMLDEGGDGPDPPVPAFLIFLSDGSGTARSMNHLEL